MKESEDKILLTQYAHGAGCGCKIAPQVLKEILKNNLTPANFGNLLVGNNSNDDAAVFDLGDQKALISTVDFFTPIVDDAYDFGRVAAANAISDVYAMGGKPIMAIAMLGWPINKLNPALAQRVIEGARMVCAEVGIPLAGGHSIESTEPIFGLSVNGLITHTHLKKNNTAQEGDFLFLTKALGVGILSTAQKRNLLRDEDKAPWIQQLTQLNRIGEQLGKIKGVTAMTDVTGFGLLGHLIEMAEGSGLSASLNYDKVPKLNMLPHYIAQGIVPDATYRNWNAYQPKTYFDSAVSMAEAFSVLADTQTNGGLLFSVDENSIEDVQQLLMDADLHEFAEPIGQMKTLGEKVVFVKA